MINVDQVTSIMTQFGNNEDIINRLFNKTIGKKVPKKYSEELRKFAITLHFFSSKAYNYVRKRFNNCLPHVKTLSRWYSVIDGQPGFTKEVLDMLTIKAGRSAEKIICSLVIDEMSIREKIEYVGNRYYGYVDFGAESDKNDQIANKVLVFMIVAINQSWKIPVGYFLINNLNSSQKSQLVLQCLTCLAQCGIYICNLTFDGCSSNMNMTKTLGCNIDNIFHLNTHFPSDCGEINIIPDPSHMIKLIRNLLGDRKTIIDGDGNYIKFKYIENLVELQESEGLCLSNKVRKTHINFFKQKMKVKLATQLLSQSVAEALEFCRDKLKLSNFTECAATTKFIRIMNNAFDILNSRKLSEYGFKQALCSKNIEKVEGFFDVFKKYISNLKFTNGEYVLHSNRKTGFLGFAICFSSIINIYYRDIETGQKLKFLPVYKCSQDHLELFFGSVRAQGGYNNNPSCLQFRTAYRKLLVHTEIRDGGLGNCIPLEQVCILTATYKKAEHIINECNALYNQEDNMVNEEEIINQEHDYSFFTVYNNISQFSLEVVKYIAGFVSRRLANVIKCEVCLSNLFGNKQNFLHSFINFKDRGGLIYPSEEVIEICLKTENIFRKELVISPRVNKTAVEVKVLNAFLCREVFSYTKTHVDNPLENHNILLTKAIINNYCDIRIKYICRNTSPAEKIRNHYTKLIQFKGQ